METADILHMKEALKEALEAFERGEVPVGSVLVYQNQIIARSFNQVETLIDATAHAEMLCSQGSSRLKLAPHRLHPLYDAGAVPHVRRRPYLLPHRSRCLGAPDIRQGAGGSLISLLGRAPIHTVQVTSGVLADESAALLKDFFKNSDAKNL